MAISRMSSSPIVPYRPKIRTSDKLIFISCEGSVTEWDYFDKIVSKLFVNIKSKVIVINILEDILIKKDKFRTPEEQKQATSADPKSLLNKMNLYYEQHKDEYDFKNHPEDEFWLIMDVDDHTNETIVDKTGKSNIQKWNEVLRECKDKSPKGYRYAVSNPFFELWLLLHFDDVRTDDLVNENDIQWAVTSTHPYTPTKHFKERLKELGIPLVGNNGKKIREEDYFKYTKERVNEAVRRAKALDTIPPCDYPTDLGTTVYRLLESIAEIDSQYGNN